MKRGFLLSPKLPCEPTENVSKEGSKDEDPRHALLRQTVLERRMPPEVRAQRQWEKQKDIDRNQSSSSESVKIVPGWMWGLPPEKKIRSEDNDILATAPKDDNEMTEDDEKEADLTIKEDLATKTNVFRNVPFVPTSTEGSPKLAINALYGKVMPVPISDEAYFFWDDGGPPHSRKFTCVLVCPATYEIFPAGRHQSSKDDMMSVDADGMVWFRRKKEAAHGAAAVRYDCWYYREWLAQNPDAPRIKFFGLDEPYARDEWESTNTTSERRVLTIPPQVEESIHSRVREWKEATEIRLHAEREKEIERERAALEEAEANADREEYRSLRHMLVDNN